MGAADLRALAAELAPGANAARDVAAECIARMRASVEHRQSIGAKTWRAMSDVLRLQLIAMCTDRPADDWALRQPWEAFTPDERIAIGATARSWARELRGAEWLR